MIQPPNAADDTPVPGNGPGRRANEADQERSCATGRVRATGARLPPPAGVLDGELVTVFRGLNSSEVWWAGVDLNHRRQCRQIYSLLPLATRAPTQGRSR